jgi:hypothetical protein
MGPETQPGDFLGNASDVLDWTSIIYGDHNLKKKLYMWHVQESNSTRPRGPNAHVYFVEIALPIRWIQEFVYRGTFDFISKVT